MKKLISLLLALIMAMSVFACTKAENNKPAATTPTTTPEVTTPAVTTPAATTTKDPNALDLPDVSFDGAKYRIASEEGNVKIEVFAGEGATDLRSDALMRRNGAVEDGYDVKITPVAYSGASNVYSHAQSIINMILSEEDYCDISLTYAVSTGLIASAGCAVNWMSFENTDFSKLYWISGANELLIFDDAIYTPVGDMCISTIATTYGMFYNKTKGNQTKGLTDQIFEAVKNKTWTIDYFNGIVSEVYSDIDNVNGPSEDDYYGFTAENLTNLDVWQFAFDIPMVVQDEETVLKCVFNSERTAIALDKINRLYWENNGSNIFASTACTGKFIEGKALFHTTWLDQCFYGLRNMEDSFTILPYPMYDDNQENYKTGMMDNYNVITMPFTCPDKEMASIITEAMNYYSREYVYPAYYEESLQKQAVQDPESVEMLDIIMEGRTFDLGTIFSPSLAGLSMCFRSAVSNNTTDFATFFATIEERVSIGISDLIASYEVNKQN